MTAFRLRDRASLATQVATLDGPVAKAVGDFERGAAAALRWLLDGGPGPSTGDPAGRPTSARPIVRELAAAEAEIHSARSDRRIFAQGVEHALMWAQYVTSAPPGKPIGR